MHPIAKAILIIFLLMVGLLTLGATICGGIFTFVGKNEYGLWMISIPSMLIGGVATWAIYKALVSVIGRKQHPAPTEQSADDTQPPD